MRTNIVIDDTLMQRAMEISGLKTNYNRIVSKVNFKNEARIY